MPDALTPAKPVIWVHDLDQPKYKQVLQDSEVFTQIIAIHARLQAIFSDAGFRAGRMSHKVTASHLDAVSKKDVELLDLAHAGRLVVSYTLKSDYKGGITASLILQALRTGSDDDWKTLLKIERDAFQLNWQTAQENFTGRFRRDDILTQLRDQQFFDVEVALPLDWVQLALDALEP